MSVKNEKSSGGGYVCSQCTYAELQCPPVIRCKLKNTYKYLDDPACPEFKSAEE